MKHWKVLGSLICMLCLTGCFGISNKEAEPEIKEEHEITHRIDFLGRDERLYSVYKTDNDTLVATFGEDDTIWTDKDVIGRRGMLHYEVAEENEVQGLTLEPYIGSEKLKYCIKDDNTAYVGFDDTVLKLEKYTLFGIDNAYDMEESVLGLRLQLLSEVPMQDNIDTRKRLFTDDNKVSTDAGTIIVMDREIPVKQMDNENEVYIGKYKVYWLETYENTMNYIKKLQTAGMIESSAQIKNGFTVFRLRDGSMKALRAVGDTLIYFDDCNDYMLTGIDVEEKDE